MTKTTKTKVPIKVEIIPVRVKPADFKKSQADVAVLEQDVSNKQKAIEKLQADLAVQQQTSADLEGRIENLEGMVAP